MSAMNSTLRCDSSAGAGTCCETQCLPSLALNSIALKSCAQLGYGLLGIVDGARVLLPVRSVLGVKIKSAHSAYVHAHVQRVCAREGTVTVVHLEQTLKHRTAENKSKGSGLSPQNLAALPPHGLSALHTGSGEHAALGLAHAKTERRRICEILPEKPPHRIQVRKYLALYSPACRMTRIASVLGRPVCVQC